MNLTIIIFLAVLVVILGFNVSSLQKELLSARKNAAFYEERSDGLQRKLMRINRMYVDKERFLDEIEQNIAELEIKIPLETLERYIPKKKWNEIKPIINRLKAFQEQRENNKLSKKNEEDY